MAGADTAADQGAAASPDVATGLDVAASPEAVAGAGAGTPLYVDGHGAILATDLTLESVLGAMRHNPKALWRLPLWIVAGQARAELASRASLDMALLPLNEAALTRIADARAAGRRVVFVTHADAALARAFADHLGLFDAVIASTAETPLDRCAMREAITADAALHGGTVFDYLGRDPVLLDAARRGASTDRRHKGETIHRDRPGLREVVKALRVHQWLKNAFLFVPLALTIDRAGVADIAHSIVAFLAFSLVASATYVVNDLLDLQSDRRHASKCLRPLAAGRLSIRQGAGLGLAVFAAGAALAAMLPFAFQALLACYIVVTLSYSIAVKRMLLLDVLTVSGLHTLRIMAGGAALGIEVSYWLLSFSLFFFLSLALAKRYTELAEVGETADRASTGRGYRYVDLETLALMGVCSSFSAVVVLALYIRAPVTLDEVTHPWLMWPICPLMLYALARIWILARRRELQEDPVWFALTDWRSQVTFGLTALIYLVAHVV